MTTAQKQRDLAQRIREKREQRGLSQNDLALRMHRTRPTIADIEHLRRQVTALELVELSEIFHCTMDYLIYGGEKET